MGKNKNCKRCGSEKRAKGTCHGTKKQCPGRDCSNCQNCVVNLTYEKIYDDFWPDQTGAILHQFTWQETDGSLGLGIGFAGNRVVEVEKELVTPVNRTLLDTQPSSSASVYGYNADGTLDLTGGRQKSYVANFTDFPFLYHAAKEGKYFDPSGTITQILQELTPSVVQEWFDTYISYFGSRGYALPPPDVFSQFDHQYIWTFPAGQNQGFTADGYVAIRFVWGEGTAKCNNFVPTFVDLHASSNINGFFVLDVYEPNPLNRKNGHGYPLRIPVTTDFCTVFQQAYNVSPIAFFDKSCGVLTIHVPERDEGYFLTNKVVDTGFPPLNTNYEEHLLAFDGSFAVLKRCKKECEKAELTNTSDARKTYCLAQNSENVHIKSRAVSFGTPTVYDFSNPIRSPFNASLGDPTIYYTGVVAGRMNSGSASFDIFVLPVPPRVQDYVVVEDPLQLPEETQGEFPHPAGDDPVTTVVEKYSSASNATTRYYSGTRFGVVELPKNFIDAINYFPENVDTSPVPSNPSNADTYKMFMGHEFQHVSQDASGILLFLPFEAMATSTEVDTKLMGNVLLPLRSQAFASRTVSMTRGIHTAMTSNSVANTYGISLFWIYCRTLFDFNNQLARRVSDILTSETAGPLLRANDFPDTFEAPIINNTGGNAALNQALGELFGFNVKDVWNNFSIALTLLRNNTSIPSVFRTNYPFWMYNTAYSGYPQLVSAIAVSDLIGPVPIPIVPFANWWEKTETNQTIPPNWFTAFPGETVIRTLPPSFSANLKNLHTVSFNVPHSLTTITITITAGEWRLTLFQFTSDGTQVGSWIQDGPVTIVGAGVHVFTVTGHIPAFTATGNIRLTCANVSFSGTGNILADYFSPEPNTGSISIIAV